METFHLKKQVLYVHTNEVFSTVSHEMQVKLTTLSGSCNAIYLHWSCKWRTSSRYKNVLKSYMKLPAWRLMKYTYFVHQLFQTWWIQIDQYTFLKNW